MSNLLVIAISLAVILFGSEASAENKETLTQQSESQNTKLEKALSLIQQHEYVQASKLLTELAKNENDGVAQWLLGDMHFYGNGYNEDKKTACQWYAKAAKNEIPVALDRLGSCYLKGYHQKRDIGKAIDSFELATQLGHHISLCNIADIYYQGIETKVDVNKAIALCEKSAMQSSSPAMVRVGKMYLNAQRDDGIKLATHWFLTAANFENPEAYYFLGKINRDGIGTKVDIDSALYWFEKSATLGFSPAYIETAKIYANAPKDPDSGKWQEAALAKAYVWGQAAKLSATVLDEQHEISKLMYEVDKEMPVAWRQSLDQKVTEHLSKFSL